MKKRRRSIVRLGLSGMIVLLLVVALYLINPDQRQEGTRFTLRNALNGVYCSQPCWQTLVPGETTFEVFQLVLANAVDDVNIVDTLEGQDYLYEWQYEDSVLHGAGEKGVLVVFSEDRRVFFVRAAVDICVSTILEAYGLPTYVMAPSNEFSTTYELFYPDERLAFLVKEQSPALAYSVARATDAYFESGRGSTLWTDIEPLFTGECHDVFQQ